ncbi:MAG: DUF370 domain-containing protein [Oscillospiraceae bacterium]|nr:DUF370 domain-containing protein [Oscillospiraceae bacterium]
MYVHLGGGVTVPSREVAAVFDLDNATTSIHTRRFLERAQEEGMLLPIGEDLPKSLVVCCPRGGWQRVYLSPMSPATLQGRLAGPGGARNGTTQFLR